MAFCPKCGSELEPGNAFCGSCGAPIPGAAEAGGSPGISGAPSLAKPTQPAAAPLTPPSYGLQTPPAASYPASSPVPATPPGGGGGKVALFALLGLLVIGGIVALLLGFAVGPKWFTGGGMTEQAKVADDFFRALERKDAKLLIGTIAPSSMKEVEQLLDYGYYETLEEMFEETFFSEYQSLKFEGLGYKTTVKGDKATVEVVKGKMTMVDSYGDKETKDVKDADLPVELPLLKEEGKWYIDFEDM